MLLSLRQIKGRIRGVSNTKKITQAMEMVSGSKLKRAEGALFELKPYFTNLESLLKNLAGSVNRDRYPFLKERQAKGSVALCVITSDTGLCSTYNDNIIRMSEDFIGKYGRDKVKLIIVGKRGFSYFRKYNPEMILQSFTGLNGRLSNEVADRLIQVLIQIFLNQEVDEVYGIYTQFINAVKYRPTLEKLLNIEPGAGNKEEYIFEPGVDKILEELLPIYFSSKIRFLLLNSFTAEHSARMIAMKAATDNAAELIDTLTLLRNKARQTSITKEVIEVSSAAETLKG